MYSLHFFQRTTEYLAGNAMDCKHNGKLLRVAISLAGDTPELRVLIAKILFHL
jgi:hypothetical protein